MAENKLADISTEFAIQILKLTDSIKGHYSLSNQLERYEGCSFLQSKPQRGIQNEFR